MINLSNAFDLVVRKLENWIRELIIMLPNLGLAILIVLLGYLIARLVRKFFLRMMRNVTRHATLLHLATNTVYLIIILVAAFIALGVLKLDTAVTSLLAGAGIIGLALGFAFQDIAANFMSGIIMAIRSPFREGDIIESQDHMGIVHEMNLRATVIRSFEGQYHIIPNKEVLQNTITNYTRLGKRRIDLEVGISYGEDLERVRDLTLGAIRSLEFLLPSEDLSLYYDEFGDSSINFKIRFWIDFNRQPDFLKAKSEAIIAIKKTYDKNDIMIPFPIRTLDFGIKGGEKLNEVISKDNLS